jgi:hypothetical protein
VTRVRCGQTGYEELGRKHKCLNSEGLPFQPAKADTLGCFMAKKENRLALWLVISLLSLVFLLESCGSSNSFVHTTQNGGQTGATLFAQILAGTGDAGFENGPVAQAQFNNPQAVAVGPDGSIYVADTGNHSIRVIANGVVSTLAGTGVAGNVDGPGNIAQFDSPFQIGVDSNSIVYVRDANTGTSSVRRISPDGVTSTVNFQQLIQENALVDGLTPFRIDENALVLRATGKKLPFEVAQQQVSEQGEFYFTVDDGELEAIHFPAAPLDPVASGTIAFLNAAPAFTDTAVIEIDGLGQVSLLALGDGGDFPPSLLEIQVVLNEDLLAPLQGQSDIIIASGTMQTLPVRDLGGNETPSGVFLESLAFDASGPRVVGADSQNHIIITLEGLDLDPMVDDLVFADIDVASNTLTISNRSPLTVSGTRSLPSELNIPDDIFELAPGFNVASSTLTIQTKDPAQAGMQVQGTVELLSAIGTITEMFTFTLVEESQPGTKGVLVVDQAPGILIFDQKITNATPVTNADTVQAPEDGVVDTTNNLIWTVYRVDGELRAASLDDPASTLTTVRFPPGIQLNAVCVQGSVLAVAVNGPTDATDDGVVFWDDASTITSGNANPDRFVVTGEEYTDIDICDDGRCYAAIGFPAGAVFFPDATTTADGPTTPTALGGPFETTTSAIVCDGTNFALCQGAFVDIFDSGDNLLNRVTPGVGPTNCDFDSDGNLLVSGFDSVLCFSDPLTNPVLQETLTSTDLATIVAIFSVMLP